MAQDTATTAPTATYAEGAPAPKVDLSNSAVTSETPAATGNKEAKTESKKEEKAETKKSEEAPKVASTETSKPAEKKGSASTAPISSICSASNETSESATESEAVPTPVTPPAPELPSTGEEQSASATLLGAALGMVGLAGLAKRKKSEE